MASKQGKQLRASQNSLVQIPNEAKEDQIGFNRLSNRLSATNHDPLQTEKKNQDKPEASIFRIEQKSFVLPDISDEKFTKNLEGRFDKIGQLRLEASLPKVHSDRLLVKLNLQSQSDPNSLNINPTNLQNSQRKPRGVKQFMWEQFQKKKKQQHENLVKRQRSQEHPAVRKAYERFSLIQEPLEVRVKKQQEILLQEKLKEVYGFEMSQNPSKDQYSGLLKQKAIIDLIRFGANLPVNSSLIKDFLLNQPSMQSRNIDIANLKEVDLEGFKKRGWNQF